MKINMSNMNTKKQISRAEKTSEEKNQDHEMQRKQKKRREIADSIRKEEQEKKENRRERIEMGYDAQNYSHENPIAMFRTNVELDKHSKDNKEANPVPENQP